MVSWITFVFVFDMAEDVVCDACDNALYCSSAGAGNGVGVIIQIWKHHYHIWIGARLHS
jgi:hypothetical protein